MKKNSSISQFDSVLALIIGNVFIAPCGFVDGDHKRHRRFSKPGFQQMLALSHTLVFQLEDSVRLFGTLL